MAYRVPLKLVDEQTIISEEKFHTLEQAINEADLSIYPGWRPVEIVVLDKDGAQHFRRLPSQQP